MNTNERRAFTRPDWAPDTVDIDKPSVARVYDWFLDGSYNFEADRRLGRRLLAACPYIKTLANLNRRFLTAAVRELAMMGVTQFIDLGAGIPSAGAVHEVVREFQPDARVVYVDNDPVAIAHGELMLGEVEGVVYIDGDLTAPDEVFRHELVKKTLVSEVPTAVIACAALHLVPDSAKPAALIEAYRKLVAPGSWLVLSHGTRDQCPPMAEIERLYLESGNPYYPRGREEVEQLLASVELLDPGVTLSAYWHCDLRLTDEEMARSGAWVGVGQWR